MWLPDATLHSTSSDARIPPKTQDVSEPPAATRLPARLAATQILLQPVLATHGINSISSRRAFRTALATGRRRNDVVYYICGASAFSH